VGCRGVWGVQERVWGAGACVGCRCVCGVQERVCGVQERVCGVQGCVWGAGACVGCRGVCGERGSRSICCRRQQGVLTVLQPELGRKQTAGAGSLHVCMSEVKV
jgi:hypothetical protein